MRNYADYAYYTGIYKGSVIGTDSFNSYARKASLIIRQYTFNRIKDDTDVIPDDVKMCCCETAEAIYGRDKAEGNGAIAAEKVGDQSKTYVDAEKQEQLYQSKVGKIISLWLADTGLLYRGCV